MDNETNRRYGFVEGWRLHIDTLGVRVHLLYPAIAQEFYRGAIEEVARQAESEGDKLKKEILAQIKTSLEFTATKYVQLHKLKG